MIKYIYKVFPCKGDECTKFFLHYDEAIEELQKQCAIQAEAECGFQVYLECDKRKPDDYVSVEGKSDFVRVYLMECNSNRYRILRGDVCISELRFEE